jgi:mRNA-degrading endonuclease RelE of RelBE toxin-antitoxin system
MSRYDVSWPSDVLDALAKIWLNAPDRAAITAAQAAIDNQLSLDPKIKSSEVAEGLRKLKVPPLRVYFEIDEQNRVATVTGISLDRSP